MDGFVFQKLLEEKKRKGSWLVLEVVVLEVVVLEDVALADVVLEEDVVEEEAAVDVELVLVVADVDSVVVVDVDSSPEPAAPWFEEPPLPFPLVGTRGSADAISAWPNPPVKAPPRVRLCLGAAQCLPLWRFPALVRHAWRLDERGGLFASWADPRTLVVATAVGGTIAMESIMSIATQTRLSVRGRTTLM